MMTYDEALAALKARAPLDDLRRKADATPTTAPAEEFAYHFGKWARKNGTDEELEAIGMRR